MPDQDAAVRLTQRYLDVIEKCMKISWNERGLPVCVIDWIRDDDVAAMREQLDALFEGGLPVEARQATIDYGRERIQTVGFGLVQDFDQFIKLGLIYGERVVLWDVIGSRMLASARAKPPSTSLLAQVCCQLLMLRPVVERGGVVVLPHPVTWSGLAAEIDTELRALGEVPAASRGLSMAFAAIEEGLPLHPYTLLADGARPVVADGVSEQVDELFSTRNYVFQQAVGSLLRDQRVAYLQQVRIEDFFDVVAQHDALRRAIRKHFSHSLDGLSAQQAAREVDSLTEDLLSLIAKRNAAVIDYKAEGVDATGKFILASVASISLGLPLIDTLAIAGAMALPLSTAVRKWAKKPERNVIVHAFQALQDAADSSRSEPLAGEAMANIHPSIADLYAQFMSFYWTEERHHFLESLSPEVARALLAELGPDDLEIIVNARRFQQDYIGDYLAYLSELDDDIYWEHLGKTFESEEGLLIYDDDAHIRAMETRDMPLKAWQQLLDSLFEVYADELTNRSYGYLLECFPAIIHFQTEGARYINEKRKALVKLFETLGPEEQDALIDFLKEAFCGDLPDWFASFRAV